MTTAGAIESTLSHETNSGYTSNVSLQLESIAQAISQFSNAITPSGAAPANCPTGEGYVGSLTEAGVSIASALVKIANAIGDLAEAVRESRA